MITVEEKYAYLLGLLSWQRSGPNYGWATNELISSKTDGDDPDADIAALVDKQKKEPK